MKMFGVNEICLFRYIILLPTKGSSESREIYLLMCTLNGDIFHL